MHLPETQQFTYLDKHRHKQGVSVCSSWELSQYMGSISLDVNGIIKGVEGGLSGKRWTDDGIVKPTRNQQNKTNQNQSW